MLNNYTMESLMRRLVLLLMFSLALQYYYGFGQIAETGSRAFVRMVYAVTGRDQHGAPVGYAASPVKAITPQKVSTGSRPSTIRM